MECINGAGHRRDLGLSLEWGDINHHSIWIQKYLPTHLRAGKHQASPVLDTKLLQLPRVGFTGVTQSLGTHLFVDIT
ncbi:hypothetical protein D3C76_1486720 [compost metagenome]